MPLSEITGQAILRELRTIKMAVIMVLIGMLIILAVIAAIGTGIISDISNMQSLAVHTAHSTIA
jgi:hypothetical protein